MHEDCSSTQYMLYVPLVIPAIDPANKISIFWVGSSNVLSKRSSWKRCPQMKSPYKDVFYVWNNARIEAGLPTFASMTSGTPRRAT